MDFTLGAIAASGAVLFTNPLDVIKTRMQLQGELRAQGQYSVSYRNIFHAAFTIAKVDGLSGLQKGLSPAISYQIIMNGTRLGLYNHILNSGIISNSDGSVSTFGCVLAGASVGITGGVIGSPLYLIKTHLQSQAHQNIAVGYQHKHSGLFDAARHICKTQGVLGLWRGCSSSIPRVGVGSASQLVTYSKTKDWLHQYQIFERSSWESTFVGAMMSGLVIAFCMSPFDVIATRLYNQGTDSQGKGLLYKNIFDCAFKIFKKEGIHGFYKGITAIYFRIGPHSFLNLIFWDFLKKTYEEKNK